MRRGASGLGIVVVLLACAVGQAGVARAAQPRPLAPVARRAAGGGDLTPTAQRQIAALAAEKRGRTGAARRLADDLRTRLNAAETSARSLPADRAETDLVTVDLSGTVDAELDAGLARLGAVVLGRYPQYGSVRAEVPALRLDDVAALPGVRTVRPAEVPELQAVSEGLSAHEVGPDPTDAQAVFGVDGTGQKVCVLSDGLDDPSTPAVDEYAQSLGAGEITAVDVLPGQQGSNGAEGLAMLEIVHDLAPGATLGFATGLAGAASMAQNIVLLGQSGCTIIVDDIGYGLESPFQDDIIAQAVNTVTAEGVVYLSSAGNSGNAAAGTSGTWEGDFLAGPSNVAGTFHDFAPADPDRFFDRILQFAPGRVLTLSWPDPIGAAVSDYDLYVVDVAGNVLARSTADQSQTGAAFEALTVPAGAASIAVTLFEGPPSALRLHLSRGVLEFATTGATFGHNAALNTISVGATPAAAAQLPGGPFGPVAGQPFTNVNEPELFSSDGPRRVYYSPTGTPYTPGNSSASGGVVLHKPDILAADGTTTSVPDFAPFFGTSAAAPHAAAITALLRQLRPTATRAQIVGALRAGTIDLGTPGYNADSGYGILMAKPALQALVDATAGPVVPVPVEPDFVPVAPQRFLETRADTGQVGYSGSRPVAGQVIELQIVGVGTPPVPGDAKAVVLNVTGTGATADGFVTVYPCGAARPTASNLNLATNDTRANLVVSKIGDGGRVCLFTLNPTHLIADVAGYMPGGSPFLPVVPERLLETRAAGQTGYAGDKPAPGQTVELQVTGAGGTAVPADAEAVVLNITATEATNAGFVTVYPCGIERPNASNLNLTPGVTAANLVVSKLGAGGKVCIFTQWGGHLLADVAGYQPAGASYEAVAPVRVLDTRLGVGAVGPAAAGRVIPLTVRGANGVPAGATTVVLNVTATDVAAAGFVTVWPCAEPQPTASNVNVPRADTRPNLVFAKIDVNGQVCLFTQQPMALVADQVGWYP